MSEASSVRDWPTRRRLVCVAADDKYVGRLGHRHLDKEALVDIDVYVRPHDVNCRIDLPQCCRDREIDRHTILSTCGVVL